MTASRSARARRSLRVDSSPAAAHEHRSEEREGELRAIERSLERSDATATSCVVFLVALRRLANEVRAGGPAFARLGAEAAATPPACPAGFVVRGKCIVDQIDFAGAVLNQNR